MTKLQVLISTYGEEGIRRLASHRYPAHPEVEYIVSWQKHDLARLPGELRERKDFQIYPEDTIGLCNNRNNALRHATAPIVLTSDDDLTYTLGQLQTVIDAFAENPDMDFLTFRYEADPQVKVYPEKSFMIDAPPKGYFVSSVELGLNLKRLRESGKLGDVEIFNPAFGVNGTHFSCGEEDILIADLNRKGFSGRYIPEVICRHEGDTTSERIYATREFIETKGAVTAYIHPLTWPLRVAVHAWRERDVVPFLKFCLWSVGGVRKLRSIKK